MEEQVILVDNNDNAIGSMAKLEAHQKGLLHRAFSIFIFNSNGELLLQQRALDKYHSEGLWSNTCCSHPRIGETILDAAKRRLNEELGVTCELTNAFNFTYKANFDNGLIEHEFDYVLFGFSDEIPQINTQEVNNWKYISVSDLLKDLKLNSTNYTAWLKDCFDKVIYHIDLLKNKNI